MKNSIQLNIGTATVDGQTLAIPEIATALRRHGLVLTLARVVTGQWEGKEETTLAVECLPALPVCHHECRLAITSAIGKLSKELRQTCIALAWPDGSGELCPPVSGQTFDPLFFHPADKVTFAETAGVPAVSLSKKAIGEICDAACKVPNGPVKENLLMTLLSHGIAPEGLLIPGNPEIVSGW